MIVLDDRRDDFAEKHTLNGKVHTNELVGILRDNFGTPYGKALSKAKYRNDQAHSLHSPCVELYVRQHYGVYFRGLAFEGKLHRKEGYAGYGKSGDRWFVHGVELSEIYDELV